MTFFVVQSKLVIFKTFHVLLLTTLITISDSVLWEMFPKGTCSLLVQPVLQIADPNVKEKEKTEGFVLLASSRSYAYSDKDRAWIRAIANKFRRKFQISNV